jgi:hypothetical protein
MLPRQGQDMQRFTHQPKPSHLTGGYERLHGESVSFAGVGAGGRQQRGQVVPQPTFRLKGS